MRRRRLGGFEESLYQVGPLADAMLAIIERRLATGRLPLVSKLVLGAWIVVAVCLVAAGVAAVAQPMHWERTVAAAAVLGVISAAVAVVRSRRDSAG
jgi:chromate transport protein ChrA